jgi:hypothetical protein
VCEDERLGFTLAVIKKEHQPHTPHDRREDIVGTEEEINIGERGGKRREEENQRTRQKEDTSM